MQHEYIYIYTHIHKIYDEYIISVCYCLYPKDFLRMESKIKATQIIFKTKHG